MAWNKDTNIREAGIWLSRKIGLIEEKDILIKNRDRKARRTGKMNQSKLFIEVVYSMPKWELLILVVRKIKQDRY